MYDKIHYNKKKKKEKKTQHSLNEENKIPSFNNAVVILSIIKFKITRYAKK